MTAQSIHYNYQKNNVINLEFNKPFFKGDYSNGDFFSYDAYLNVEFEVGRQANKIAVELPFYRVSVDNIFGRNTVEESFFGNISVAYQFRKLTSASYLEFKLRIPTGFEDSLLFGGTDYTERLTANILNVWSLEPNYLFDSNKDNGGYLRIKSGVKMMFGTGTGFGDDFEAFLDLHGTIGYRNNKIDFNVGITSTTLLTEDLKAAVLNTTSPSDEPESFPDRSFLQAFATITYKINKIEPGLIIRLPLNSGFKDIYSTIVGLQLGYRFGRSSNHMQEIKRRTDN